MPSTKNAPKKKKIKKGPATKKGWITAKTADRHDLYERSVQEPEAEADLVEQVWREQRKRPCVSIREDFCGTAAVCMEWVKRRRVNVSLGVDLDDEVLAWAAKKIPQRLTKEQQERITLVKEDVRTVDRGRVDCILAMNFSYYGFKTRPELRTYFEHVHRGLKDDGLFLLDAYGGSDSFLEMEEDRDLDGFTYTWDQHAYDPITSHAETRIHFKFPDGSEMRDAFQYDWRIWSLPEIRELLIEAGFSKVVIYWEGTDEETEEGNGEWEVAEVGEACPGWVAYVVAFK